MKRCLIADKSEIIRKVARHYLEQAQVEVLEADSADAALAVIREKGTDAVILDWRLPGKTTIEFLSALRFGDKAKRPLVVYATTENDPADLSRAFAAGADSYLIKPFDQNSFMESMANAGVAA
ncbi:response regulator [Hyphomicrobium sp.]|uniref:response regulator n=1 Tax=Hyphomicrobium sp. TaxID=82 RepID=UPI002B95C500|nr:response regulator [Hyphomicrobium sp.]HRN88097.1 response regulator [Hyphomicrobium sp.]HRQ25901.1 response regulator [Hyphomicrobium sp.]